ncbi:MAG: hypothetical protein GZ094_07295 [Mariniphaga sp.]|nr:hypothetical protein [Mariniphaga sp.]
MIHTIEERTTGCAKSEDRSMKREARSSKTENQNPEIGHLPTSTCCRLTPVFPMCE